MTTRLYQTVATMCLSMVMLLFLSIPKRAHGADSFTIDNWQISGEQIIEYKELSSIVAMGDVNLIELGKSPRRIVEADWLSYDAINKVIKVRGNVFLHGAPSTVKKPPVLDTAFISTVGSNQSINLIQTKGFRSYQQSDKWLVSFEGQESGTTNQEVAQKEVKPLYQEPLTGTETYSTEDWDISSEQMFHLDAPKSLIASGSVILRKKRTTTGDDAALIYADWLSYDIEQKAIKLRGNVRVDDGKSLGQVAFQEIVIEERDYVDRAVSPNYAIHNNVGNWLIAYEKTEKTAAIASSPTKVSPPKAEPITQKPLEGIEKFSSDDWDIASDEMLHLESPDSVIASGNVILRKKRTNSLDPAILIYSDWLAYDIANNSIKTRGNIRIEDSLSDSDSAVYDEIVIEDQSNASKAFDSEYASRNQVDNWLIAYEKSGRKAAAKQPASATSTEEWDIAADRVIRYENPNSVVAVGNVVLTKRERIAPTKKKPSNTSQWNDLLNLEQAKHETTVAEVQQSSTPDFKTTTTIYADWIAYDVDLGIIKAKGNVRIDNGKENLFAKEGDVEINSETGRFEDAVLTQTNKLHLEGKKIEKTGVDTYHITEGWVITCKVEEGETPPWSISSAETDVRQGGYAVLKHAKFNVKGVPIFYTPYMVLPVKNTRQTGFLLPEISSSGDKGLGINTPFFWNISESTDMTIYPQYFADRGFMPGMEFRYVVDAESKGVLDASYLDDDLDTDDTDYTHTNSERYWLRGKADHTFGNGWITRLDLDIVSDKDYLTEFNSGATGFDDTHDRYLEAFGRGFSNKKEDLRDSTLNLMKSWNNTYLEVGLLGVNDVRIDSNGDDIETDKPFWKLPEITYSGAIPLDIMPVTFDWSSNYVNFWREDGYGGHRVDLQPSISANLPISDLLESSAEFGIRNTYYSMEDYGSPISSADEWDGDSSENRFLYDFELEIATTLERDFYSSNSQSDYLENIIRPYLRYNYLSDEDQEDLPDFDLKDRIDEENGITYGFDTYLISFTSDDEGNRKSRQYAFFEMEQTFYLSDLTKYKSNGNAYVYEDDLSDLSAKLRWYPWEKAFLEYKTEYNMYGDGFVSHNLDGRYTNERGDTFGLEYSFKDENVEQINGYLDLKINREWSIKFDFEHSIFDDETEEANFGLTYTQPCWAVTVGTEYTPEDTTFMIMFELANIGMPIGGSM